MGVPNPLFDANGDPYSGAVLKAYLPGTTTSTSIAIDSSGSSPQTSITYNAEGKLEVSGNEIEAYIDRKHKYGIFANATDAAANTPFYMGPFDNVEQTANSSDTVKTFATLAAAVAATTIEDGDTLNIAERTSGNGGGAMWDVVLSSTVTENTYDVVQCTGVGTLSLVLRVEDFINAKAAGMEFDGSTDDTLALQSLTATALANGVQYILFPAGATVITDSITCATATGIGLYFIGITPYLNGFVSGNNKTRILFQPTSVKDLFVYDGTGAVTTYGSKGGLANISITGNSSSTGDNSRYCINLDNMSQMIFSNVGIEKFEAGVYTKDCMDNNYNQMYIQTCYTAGVQYPADTGLTTTDTWEGGRIAVCPWAIIIVDGISLKFNNMILENNAEGICNVYKEAFSVVFNNCHCEDNPTENNAAHQNFRVGYDGTTLAADNTALTISNCHFTGRAAGAVGTWLAVDEADQVKVDNCHIRGFTTGVTTTANTVNGGAVMLTNPNFTSVSTVISEDTAYDVVGIYPTVQINSSPNPRLIMPVIKGNFVQCQKALNFNGTPQTLTGPGAVALETAVTHIVTTGADALTLADATTDGEVKYIVMKTDGGAGTLTPTNLANGTTITFDDVGDSAHLIFTNSAWHFMGGTATLA